MVGSWLESSVHGALPATRLLFISWPSLRWMSAGGSSKHLLHLNWNCIGCRPVVMSHLLKPCIHWLGFSSLCMCQQVLPQIIRSSRIGVALVALVRKLRRVVLSHFRKPDSCSFPHAAATYRHSLTGPACRYRIETSDLSLAVKFTSFWSDTYIFKSFFRFGCLNVNFFLKERTFNVASYYCIRAVGRLSKS